MFFSAFASTSSSSASDKRIPPRPRPSALPVIPDLPYYLLHTRQLSELILPTLTNGEAQEKSMLLQNPASMYGISPSNSFFSEVSAGAS